MVEDEMVFPSPQGGQDWREEGEEGVLLYYKYAPVPDVPALVHLYESNCKSLGLLGRVRVAPDGVNVTVGGKMSALEKHIAVMRSDSLFEGTDFKLAPCSGPRDERIARECGFTSLAIRVVKELVTFSPHPLLMSPSISNAGKHLSPLEFHSVLNGNKLECSRPFQHEKLVLLDARNLYETRIGMFHRSHVETLNPEIRQYSDLPTWIDAHSDQLKGNHVLMYCTGGIRCEMASAYIRSKGPGFENVFQLYGGIQRYLEQFPDGGFFKGKNFVFDHRISVGSKNTDIVGKCILCASPFDDYSPRCRCTHCRMLVLVCNGCQENSREEYACELCQRNEKTAINSLIFLSPDEGLDSSNIPGTVQAVADSSANFMQIPPMNDILGKNVSRNICSRKLRILCLHGFRQNASSFKGRMSSVAKKLKNVAELIFIDAPHELPFIYQQCQKEINPISLGHPSSPPPLDCKRRFAWLVAAQSTDQAGQDWKMAAGPFDPFQYQQQTDGFEESYAYLKGKIAEMGTFDGILGFSQGAAMVALVCEQQKLDNSPDFRFAVLCSGFSLFSKEKKTGSINFPSLHIFGSTIGGDRQIDAKASKELAELFDSSCSKIIEHEMGHIIPAKSPYIGQMQEFLEQFL